MAPYEADERADFEIYHIGLACISVCSNLSPEETVEKANAEHPTGISSRWEISTAPNFRSGEPNPCPCNRAPVTHKHYLMEC